LPGGVDRSQRRVVPVVAVKQGGQGAGVARAVAARQAGYSIRKPDFLVRDLLPDLAGLGVAGDDALEVADVHASAGLGGREKVEVVVGTERPLVRFVVGGLGRDAEVVPEKIVHNKG